MSVQLGIANLLMNPVIVATSYSSDTRRQFIMHLQASSGLVTHAAPDYISIQDIYGGTGGLLTPIKLISASSTNATLVHAGNCGLYEIICSNNNASARYLKLYNSMAITVGTTVPVWTILIPGLGGISKSLPEGVKFGTGLSFALTTGYADNDVGAVAAGDLIVNLGWC